VPEASPGPDQKPLRADARRNRELLLGVAADAFAADGLSVPLDEIARRAGVGPGTLYRHFPTKESLFEAVMRDRMRALLDNARARAASTEPGAALFGFMGRVVAEAAAKRDLVDALVHADVDVTAAVGEMAADIRDAIGVLLARAQRAGVVRHDIGIAELMGLLSGLMSAVRSPSARDADPRLMLAVLWAGLTAHNDSPGA
jgi:AcrR family transcriptional regulator